ncbi:TPA: hypothetical protein N0F65_009612 [Lagenidium giganteum]|uniref:HTH CENPB-type domain-containing protein n=1 Tax=Lagenidium giganteum TaxID=4803 RepID=A0AAV2YV49_9STRA|nr:TPA: hypothetical protein N0F65_009612 [Lagenidium giganteum]
MAAAAVDVAAPYNTNVHETPYDTAVAEPLPLPPKIAGRGRRRGRGQGRKVKLSLRQPVTFQHKRAVIEFYDAHNRDINATMKQFYPDASDSAATSRKRQIYKWIRNREAIEAMCFKASTAAQTRRRDKGTATILSEAAELELVQWIVDQRQPNDAGLMLKDKAMEIADKYDVPKGSFQATWTWQQGFFKRHQITGDASVSCVDV